MAVISRGPFGGVKLTGEEAKVFVERMQNVQYNPKLAAAVERGKVHLASIKAARAAQQNQTK